ncbi:MAG: PQQ-like beta-propeller repeat protein [Candidatus Aenigmarchaeota archaeon]|nr:PQQ-like beta-propeller repeat protein [Candidatus Aenigmarchaeota archaeon]
MDFDNVVTMDIRKNPKKLHSIVWIHGFGGSIASTPSISGGRIYIGSDDNYFYCIDAETGKAKWKFKGDGSFSNGSAVFAGNMLFIGNYDGHLYALDKDAGKLIWKFKTGDKISASACVHEDRICFGSLDNYVYCLDMKGKEVWRFKTSRIIMSSPVVNGGICYIGSHDGYLYAIDADNGEEIWRFKTGGAILNTLNHSFPIKDGVIYFHSYDGFVYAADSKSGSELWRFRMSHGATEVPFLHEKTLFIATNDPKHGTIHAIDINSHKEVNRFTIEKESGDVSRFVYKNKIYFGSSRGNFYAVDKDSMKEIWQFRTDGPVWCGASLYKNMVIFGSWDCHVYALDGDNGKEIWRFVTSTKIQSPETVEEETPIELEIERKEEIDDKEEKYIERKTIEVFEDFYRTKSEYIHKSEYASESNYK